MGNNATEKIADQNKSYKKRNYSNSSPMSKTAPPVDESGRSDSLLKRTMAVPRPINCIPIVTIKRN